MQPPAGKLVERGQVVGCLDRKKQLPELVGHRGLNPLGIVILVKLSQSLVAKTLKKHL